MLMCLRAALTGLPRESNSAMRSHIATGLEYMGKCALRGSSASSTPLALSFVRYDSEAGLDPCGTQPGNCDQSPVRTVDLDAG